MPLANECGLELKINCTKSSVLTYVTMFLGTLKEAGLSKRSADAEAVAEANAEAIAEAEAKGMNHLVLIYQN